MPYILNIETATKNCSVAIANAGQTVICIEAAEQGYTHAEKLHIFIKDALAETGLSFKDIAAVAVSRGPGSYTGLRIGISAAKGICYALGIPLISLDTLTVLAQRVNIDAGCIIPMIDARRMEAYTAIFDSKCQMIRDVKAEIITEDSYADIDREIFFIGDCIEKCKTVLTKKNFIFLDDVIYPSADNMAVLGYEKYKQNDFVDVAYFEPLYLKDFMINSKRQL